MLNEIQTPVTAPLDVYSIRKDFPILKRKIHGKPLIYLDNAATTLKPQSVIDAVAEHYAEESSNIHRGVHYLSEKATASYEHVRMLVAKYINAASTKEIIFTRGTTDAINLVAQSYGASMLQPGDEIIISAMEHHSNIVPWQMLRDKQGIKLTIIPINDKGELELEEFENMITTNTKLISIVHTSNALGTINPINEIIETAHQHAIPVLVDGAQAVAHTPIDVQKLDCDFFAFSGHKIYGPTGIGVLYGKQALLEKMPPVVGGGDMIASVTFDKTIYNTLPYKFEAGTPPIAQVIGLGAALDYISSLGLENIEQYEKELLAYGTEVLSNFKGVRMIGTAEHKAAIFSFTLKDVHPHDIGTLVDQHGIAIRTGHHCAQPIMQRFSVPATARASLSFYNTEEEINKLTEALDDVVEVFK